MLMIGDTVPSTGQVGAKCGAGTLDAHHLEGYIKMAWSKSLLGPWNSSRHNVRARACFLALQLSSFPALLLLLLVLPLVLPLLLMCPLSLCRWSHPVLSMTGMRWSPTQRPYSWLTASPTSFTGEQCGRRMAT
jgi:hypothetical protein